jgi:hypothetical protein
MHGNDVLPPASAALRDTCDSYASRPEKSACSRVGPTGPLFGKYWMLARRRRFFNEY